MPDVRVFTVSATLSTALSPADAQRDGGLAQRRLSCITFQICTSRRRYATCALHEVRGKPFVGCWHLLCHSRQFFHNSFVNSSITCFFCFCLISGASCCKNSNPTNEFPCFLFCRGSILSIKIASKISPKI